MSVRRALPRRTFLKGLGTTMALPLLDAMLSVRAVAGAGQATAAAFPVRMAFVCVPNGVIKPAWTPKEVGPSYMLTETLNVLEPLKSELVVFTNLAQDNGRDKGDGAGDHARAAATLLTGAHPYKTAGANIRAGVSVDQVAASFIGKHTRLSSLELGIDPGRSAGSCDSGYSCAYSSYVSWKTPTTPMAKEINPRLAFERLFGSNEKRNPSQDRLRRSILDLVADDAQRLQGRLGKTDRQKMDEYFTSVRELEQRIERAAGVLKTQPPDFNVPEQTPEDLTVHMRLMCDIMVLAFQTDSTRVSTLMLANEGSNRSYAMVDVKEGHHSLSHHGGEVSKVDQLKRVDKYLVGQFGYLLEKLRAVKEGERTLLDNSMVMYGSGLGDGNAHSHDDLPILLAGRGGGSIATGRHVKLEKETPLNNLFLSMLDRVGAKVDKIGDSSGRLKGLEG